MDRLTNSTKLSRKEYMKKWRSENPNYFKIYYKKNTKKICKSVKRYRTSKKGRKTIQTYENTTHRKEQKKRYQKSLIEAKKKLDKLKKEGKV